MFGEWLGVDVFCLPAMPFQSRHFNGKDSNQYIAIRSYIPPCGPINDSSRIETRWRMASPGFGCSEERHCSMGRACIAVTVVLLAEARICGCIVRVDTFSGRSDEGNKGSGLIRGIN